MTERIVTHISQGGRVVIPAKYRKKLGLREGDEVTLMLDDSGLHISSRRLALRRLQELAAERIPKGVSLSEELIADRRKEAAREAEGMKSRGKKEKR